MQAFPITKVLETLYFAKMSLTHDSFRWNNEIKVWPNDSKYKFKFNQRINLEIWMVLLRLPSKNKKKPWVRLIWLITNWCWMTNVTNKNIFPQRLSYWFFVISQVILWLWKTHQLWNSILWPDIFCFIIVNKQLNWNTETNQSAAFGTIPMPIKAQDTIQNNV